MVDINKDMDGGPCELDCRMLIHNMPVTSQGETPSDTRATAITPKELVITLYYVTVERTGMMPTMALNMPITTIGRTYQITPAKVAIRTPLIKPPEDKITTTNSLTSLLVYYVGRPIVDQFQRKFCNARLGLKQTSREPKQRPRTTNTSAQLQRLENNVRAMPLASRTFRGQENEWHATLQIEHQLTLRTSS